jgi:hypothetical protein
MRSSAILSFIRAMFMLLVIFTPQILILLLNSVIYNHKMNIFDYTIQNIYYSTNVLCAISIATQAKSRYLVTPKLQFLLFMVPAFILLCNSLFTIQMRYVATDTGLNTINPLAQRYLGLILFTLSFVIYLIADFISDRYDQPIEFAGISEENKIDLNGLLKAVKNYLNPITVLLVFSISGIFTWLVHWLWPYEGTAFNHISLFACFVGIISLILPKK